MAILWLPWPPPLNRLYRAVGGGVKLSKSGRTYYDRARQAVQTQRIQGTIRRETIDFPIAVSILAIRPNRLRRDIDGPLKACLDAIQKTGVIKDDSLVVDLRIKWASEISKADASLQIRITEPD